MATESKQGNISPGLFYKPTAAKTIHKYQHVQPYPGFDFAIPRRLLSILDGPCLEWKVFQKQNDALRFSKLKGSGLMTFAFQDSDGSRRFLSAHPVVFWFYDNHKEPESRRTYEVITEGAVCKLYFDLEFEKGYNTLSDGVRMTNSFISVISFFLKENFDVLCCRKNILDLDSTTTTKFSRHLIFNLPDVMFRNNYNVGSFVKMICERLRLLLLSVDEMQEFCTRSCLGEENVKELFVMDRKGNQKLFCDEGVYTKNRHFRLYKSTKLKKQSPLLLSEENEFQPEYSGDETIPEKQLFLDSLITHALDTGERSIKILEYGHHEKKYYVVKNVANLPECPVVSGMGENSPMPVIDRYIQRIMAPGRIRCSTYLASSKRILYEISGNRFCNNIKRAHKSNNVYYIVDLESHSYYQKCHDSDCSGYRSLDSKLPPEIVFYLENEGDACLGHSELSDSELQQVWDAVQAMSEDSLEIRNSDRSVSEPLVPDFGMSDSDLLTATDDLFSGPIPDYGLSDSDILKAKI